MMDVVSGVPDNVTHANLVAVCHENLLTTIKATDMILQFDVAKADIDKEVAQGSRTQGPRHHWRSNVVPPLPINLYQRDEARLVHLPLPRWYVCSESPPGIGYADLSSFCR